MKRRLTESEARWKRRLICDDCDRRN